MECHPEAEGEPALGKQFWERDAESELAPQEERECQYETATAKRRADGEQRAEGLDVEYILADVIMRPCSFPHT